jgi:uncharacterized protein (DUF849 family)
VNDAVIIEAAINGATTKARNPNVPISTDELIADAQACFDAGASIVHHHLAEDGLSGEDAAERYLAVWREVLADRPDALWYPTINIGPRLHWYDHITPLAESGLMRMSLSDPGSVNLGREREACPLVASCTPTASMTSPGSSRCAAIITSGRASRYTNPASYGRYSPITTPVDFRAARSSSSTCAPTAD